MELTQVQKELIIKGYDAHCAEIERLIQVRLTENTLELYSLLLAERRTDVKRYCADNNIDKLDIDEATKAEIALGIIEIELKTLLKQKGIHDAELKELGIRTKKITNGIENCPWFSMFNSPVSLQWLTKNTEKILNNCDINHKYYDWVNSKVKHINSLLSLWVRYNNQKTLKFRESLWLNHAHQSLPYNF